MRTFDFDKLQQRAEHRQRVFSEKATEEKNRLANIKKARELVSEARSLLGIDENKQARTPKDWQGDKPSITQLVMNLLHAEADAGRTSGMRVPQIAERISSKLGRDIAQSSITGSIQALMRRGHLHRVSRGFYAVSPDA